MSRNDFKFENNQFSVMPLDITESFKREEWIKKEKHENSWVEIEIPGVDLEDFIGSGANGIVLRAREHIARRICAVKIWLPNRKSNHYNVYFDKYQEEVQKLASLRDPSIVTIFTADINTYGYYYSTMEWVDGITLKKFLQTKKQLPIQQRYLLLNSLLTSINNCHRMGVFHGDLHDENIIIEESDNTAFSGLKILDFGTSLLNRKNNPDYSKQRESALLLETSLKLLEEEKQNKMLEFRFYTSRNPKYKKIEESDDVRNFHPLLVSTTLKHLTEIYHIVESNDVNDAVAFDAIDLLLKTTNIDLPTFIRYIMKNVVSLDSDFKKHFFYQLVGRIDSYLFDVESIEHREIELLLCYYELLKTPSETDKEFKNPFDAFNEEKFDYNQILYLNTLEEVVLWFYKAKESLNEDEFLFFVTKLSKYLGRKYLNEYENEDYINRNYELLKKFNELKLLSTEIPQIINCVYGKPEI